MATDLTGVGKAAESIEKITSEIRVLAYEFLSPIAKESGQLLADRINAIRSSNAAKVLLKTKEKLEISGLDVGPVPLKVFVPLLESCSLEENDEMINRWANLLASASQNSIPPSYVRVLSELSPEEAKILSAIQRLQHSVFYGRIESESSDYYASPINIETLRKEEFLSSPESKISFDQFKRALLSLQRLELISKVPKLLEYGRHPSVRDNHISAFNDMISITLFAEDFLRVCGDLPT